jgi:alcohol dehydrogenase class IV
MDGSFDRERLFDRARGLLSAWKGDRYVFGRGTLPQAGRLAAGLGDRALVVCNTARTKGFAEAVVDSLKKAGVSLAGGAVVPGAGPNAPRADVYRIETCILHHRPSMIVAAGGGSTIDACKAANFLALLGGQVSPELDHWFGSGLVSGALRATGKQLLPLIAVESSASSGSHLTKYSNVTDPASGQKKLVADEAITPPRALFDYDVTATMPLPVTIDGALDSIAHCFEVFSGLPAAASQETFDLAALITETALELTLGYAPAVIRNPRDMEAREAVGLATDLGGYAIMVGGTHGPHMTSFSLVELTGHGTACGIMNPYYMVFFAPVIERQLRLAGELLKKHGYIEGGLDRLSGRDLGIAVARGMTAFNRAAGAPATLGELPGWNGSYVEKILTAAKDPQLEMKLKNMPLALSAAKVDEYLGPLIRAAAEGDFSMIKPMA